MTLVAIGHNMPGYLPEADVYAAHLDDDDDYALALRAMFEDMQRDGEHSYETSDDSGDAGMLELIDSGVNRSGGELWADRMAEFRRYGETGYTVNWVTGSVSYWIMSSEEDRCSDDTCDICYPVDEEEVPCPGKQSV